MKCALGSMSWCEGGLLYNDARFLFWGEGSLASWRREETAATTQSLMIFQALSVMQA